MEDVNFQQRSSYRNRPFPNCAAEVLKLVEKTASGRQPILAPPSSSSMKNPNKDQQQSSRYLLRDLQTSIDEHLFCFIECKGVYSTKLSAVQELQLIGMLCSFFEKQKASTEISTAFELIFFGRSTGNNADPTLHNARRAILAKTVSLAAQLRCAPLLNDAAMWMQKTCLSLSSSSSSSRSSSSTTSSSTGGISEDARQVCSRLINDYCSCGSSNSTALSTYHTTNNENTTPTSNNNSSNQHHHNHRRLQQQQRILSDLSSLSPGLVPYILASAMCPLDWYQQPSLSILEVLVDWISTDPKLILKPYHHRSAAEGQSQNQNHSPVFLGSLSEAISKLLALRLVQTNSSSSSASSIIDENLVNLYGRLELGILQLMETAYQYVPPLSSSSSDSAPCAIITPQMVAQTVKRITNNTGGAGQENENNLLSTKNHQTSSFYALFRALQSAVVYKCYRGTKRDFEQILGPYLTDYPFLEFALNQSF